MKKLIFIILFTITGLVGTSFKNYVNSQASWYGERFHGKRTASGEVYNMYDYTCAAVKSIPLGTKLEVINIRTGKSIIVRVNDRGNFKKYGRDLDLSKAAFDSIGDLSRGVMPIKYKIVE